MESLVKYIDNNKLWETAVKKPIKLTFHQDDIKSAPKKSFTIYEGPEPVIVETIVNGVKETQNTATKGDIIITGPKNEQYIVKPKKFVQLYNIQDTIAIPRPLPRIVAKISKHIWKESGLLNKTNITFQSPWGESMVLAPGDYLVKEAKNKFYRIEADAFIATYVITRGASSLSRFF